MPLSRSEQARVNGAKSRGPRTPEGKARSSRNGLKHGRYAKSASVISIEDGLAFSELLDDYYVQFAPQTAVEARVVSEIAGIDWQLTRWRAIEVAQINRSYDLRNPSHDSTGPSPDQLLILTAALEASVNESRFPAFITTRISRLLTERNNTLRALQTLRRSTPAPEPHPPSLDPEDGIFVQPNLPQNPAQPNAFPIPYDQSPLENPNRERTRQQDPPE